MRKLWIVVLVILLVAFSFAMAQEIHWANQITVLWDAPEFLVDGSPIPAEDAVAYNMYLRDWDTQAWAYVEGTETFIATVSTLSYTYTLPENVHDGGISAVRYIGGVGSPFESNLIWGSDANPPFLLGYGRVILWDAEASRFRVQ